MAPPTTATQASLLQKAKTKDAQADTTSQVLHETTEIGSRTLVAMDGQREQLGTIERGMTQINEDMGQAEDALKQMEASTSKTIMTEVSQFIQKLFK